MGVIRLYRKYYRRNVIPNWSIELKLDKKTNTGFKTWEQGRLADCKHVVIYKKQQLHVILPYTAQ